MLGKPQKNVWLNKSILPLNGTFLLKNKPKNPGSKTQKKYCYSILEQAIAIEFVRGKILNILPRTNTIFRDFVRNNCNNKRLSRVDFGQAQISRSNRKKQHYHRLGIDLCCRISLTHRAGVMVEYHPCFICQLCAHTP